MGRGPVLPSGSTVHACFLTHSPSRANEAFSSMCLQTLPASTQNSWTASLGGNPTRQAEQAGCGAELGACWPAVPPFPLPSAKWMVCLGVKTWENGFCQQEGLRLDLGKVPRAGRPRPGHECWALQAASGLRVVGARMWPWPWAQRTAQAARVFLSTSPGPVCSAGSLAVRDALPCFSNSH